MDIFDVTRREADQQSKEDDDDDDEDNVDVELGKYTSMAYQDRFREWEASGVNIIPVLSQPHESWNGESSYVQQNDDVDPSLEADSKCALVYGQMNEPPGARARVGLTGPTVAEHFRDVDGQDVLLFIDNIF